MNIVAGSRWLGQDGRVFVVLATVPIEDKEWVYYREEKPTDRLPAEFSCFKESFLSRFSVLSERPSSKPKLDFGILGSRI